MFFSLFLKASKIFRGILEMLGNLRVIRKSLNQFVSSLTADHYFLVFRGCSLLFRGCSGVLWDVPGLFRAVPGCSGGVPGCSGVFRGVPGCSGVFQGCSGVFRGVPGCSGVYRHPSVSHKNNTVH